MRLQSSLALSAPKAVAGVKLQVEDGIVCRALSALAEPGVDIDDSPNHSGLASQLIMMLFKDGILAVTEFGICVVVFQLGECEPSNRHPDDSHDVLSLRQCGELLDSNNACVLHRVHHGMAAEGKAGELAVEWDSVPESVEASCEP